MDQKPIVAVVGRPNVGKSTLFNRLIHARKAIVDDQPGVTRDRHYAEASWAGRDFMLMDTGGFVPEGRDLFNTAIREQVELGLAEADLIILVTDAATGVTETDQMLARMIRDMDKPCVLAVNKADNQRLELEAAEFWKLGLDEPQPVSAIGGRLSGDLLDRIVAILPERGRGGLEGDVRVAVIGRPNTGKSSLVNRLLGEARLLVTPIAGTTRDSIDSVVNHNGRRYVLVDTAGLRRRTKISENVEFYASLRSHAAISSSDVCILLVDSLEGLTHQDIQVLEQAVKERKGVLIAVNKWDLVTEKQTNTARDLEREIRDQIPTLAWIEITFISALTGQRTRKLLDQVWTIRARHGIQLRRTELEAALLPQIEKHPPPAHGGRWMKIDGIRQVRSNPPWIIARCSYPDQIDNHYARFLENRLREAFDLRGVPVRLDFRSRRDFLEAFGPIPAEDQVMSEAPHLAGPTNRAGWDDEEEDGGLFNDGDGGDGEEDEEESPDVTWMPDPDEFDEDDEDDDEDESWDPDEQDPDEDDVALGGDGEDEER